MNVICCSGGNDSATLIQWAHENNLKNTVVLFNDTGWAIPWWHVRMTKIKKLCHSYGFEYMETKSMGFKPLMRWRKGFPMAASKMQYCTFYLKREPTLKLLDSIDPKHEVVIYAGVRRCESQNRANHPRSIIHDSYYERAMEFPLVDFTDKDRDLMQEKSGIDILLHGSRECFPCINFNRADFRMLANYPDRINELANLEEEIDAMCTTGKDRYMFRKYRHMGAEGIKQVVKWALCDRGKYKKGDSI